MSTTKSVEKNENLISYINQFHLSPFSFNVFPQDKDRFCIVIVGSEFYAVKNVLTYVLNTFVDEKILEPSPADDPFQAGLKVLREFSDFKKESEQLKKQLAIIDLSKNHYFDKIHPSVIKFYDEVNSTWKRNMMIKKILFPNSLTNIPGIPWDKNFSHTIWLVENVEELPQVLTTISHVTFLINRRTICDFLDKKLRIKNFTLTIAEDDSIVLTSTLKQNIQIMILPREKYRV